MSSQEAPAADQVMTAAQQATESKAAKSALPNLPKKRSRKSQKKNKGAAESAKLNSHGKLRKRMQPSSNLTKDYDAIPPPKTQGKSSILSSKSLLSPLTPNLSRRTTGQLGLLKNHGA